MTDINELRQQLLARQRAAGKKISRIKSNTGAVIAGTEFDPRTSRANINRLNARQLQARLNRIESFIARPNQYVADAENRPVPRAIYQRYQRAEAVSNRMKQQRMDQVGNIQLPQGDYTIRERHAAFHAGMGPAQRRQMPNQVDVFPFNRPAGAFASADAMVKVAKYLEQSTTPAAQKRRMRAMRDQAESMVKVMNSKRVMSTLQNLSNEQFDVLWTHTNFARLMSFAYEFMMDRAGSDAWVREIFETQVGEAEDYINWASKI